MTVTLTGPADWGVQLRLPELSIDIPGGIEAASENEIVLVTPVGFAAEKS
jgi:hypothetical protein